jgi:radical SAM superfamily enzyme YgiQ (UPF0313 family)
VGLTSLNTGEYHHIGPLIGRLMEEWRGERVGVSLSSLRADSLTAAMAREIASVRRTGITLAPEAGTQRLRDVVNKGIREEDILQGARVAFESGCSTS